MAYTDIDDPKSFFNTVLFTGTASGNKAVTGVGFQPDWVWTKNRVDAYGHNLYDSVRGTGKYLQSNGNSAESSSATSMVSFDSDGFTVGTGDNVQYSSNNGVSWNWKAGGSASSNSNGSITSSVSANTTAGFSIVSYTGTGSAATIGHGLGAELACYIIKQRNTTGGWIVYHKGNTSAPETDYLRLDKTDATVDDAIFNDTAPTSSVFSIGTNAPVNTSSGTYIAYCFAEKQGYSKFGSYVGNGSSSGSYIHLGFKPIWLMAKRIDSADEWIVQDGVRAPFNEVDVRLFANSSGAEQTNGYGDVDFLANGFKWRTNSATLNASGGSYIYMAFAENPFTTSTGIPCTAR